MVLKFQLNKLMSAKVGKKNYKQKHQQVKASVAPTAATPVKTGDATTTNPTPPITTAIVDTAPKELGTTLL